MSREIRNKKVKFWPPTGEFLYGKSCLRSKIVEIETVNPVFTSPRLEQQWEKKHDSGRKDEQCCA